MHALRGKIAVVKAVAICLMAWLNWACSTTPQRSEVRKLVLDGQKAVDKNNILEALPNLQKAMELATKIGDDESYFEAAIYMALIYEQAGQSDKAARLVKSLKFMEVSNLKGYASQYYYRFMAVYSSRFEHNYKKTEYYIRKGIEMERKLYPHDTVFVYMDYSNLGEAYLRAGKYEKAWEIVRNLERAKPMEYELYKSELNVVKAALLFREKRYDESYEAALLARKFAKYYSSFENQLLSLQLLCQMDSIRGNLASYIIHRNAIDTVNRVQQRSEINQKLALTDAQKQLEMKERENKTSRTILLMAIAMMLVVIIALFVSLRILKKNSLARQHLAELEKQQLTATVEREALEKELLQLKMKQREEKLDRAYKDNVTMSARLAELPEAEESDEGLKTMEAVFKLQYGDFIERVEEKYPHLTYNDIRLMGFIRMKLQSQTIASVLNITMSSLNKSRYRLRKKLELDSDDDLNEYIGNL
ncbi:MAG: hypothetical protein PUH24_09830 [Prevotellaceae bacterium]|nr:hypothetical protein [Prevotella sp.]MDD7258546.1 hypothetical protein [Prevotellaceae bacterium]MDY6131508.1 hypothetical protein [Prevotella sp.]